MTRGESTKKIAGQRERGTIAGGRQRPDAAEFYSRTWNRLESGQPVPEGREVADTWGVRNRLHLITAVNSSAAALEQALACIWRARLSRTAARSH